MKILVTGGAGFIGSHVVEAYLRRGHSVAVVDNLNTGKRANLNPRARFYGADITDAAALRRIFKKERPDAVNHHAAIAEIIKSLRDPKPTFEVNVLGTLHVLQAMAEYGAKRIIFSSTGGAIYGASKELPAKETTPPFPLSAYGLSKLFSEQLIRFYRETRSIHYVIFRYPNVYGPRQNPFGEGGVVAIFGGQMLRGERPVIFGDGSKTRDYVYVEDIARANVTALTKATDTLVNLGSGRETRDDEVFRAVREAAGYAGEPRHAPARKGEVYRSSINAALAKKLLGWGPRVPFSEGVRRTVMFLKTLPR